jgi:putative heme-binding domain-containing protein
MLRSNFRPLFLCALLASTVLGAKGLSAQESAVAPLMKLLQSGRLPAERQGTVVEMIVKRGNANDLGFVFQQLQKPDGFTPAVRQQVLDWLADAAVTRKVLPAGDLSTLGKLITDDAAQKDPALLSATIRLASIWKVKSISSELKELAGSDKASEELQRAAITGLTNIGDATSIETLDSLARDGKSVRVRVLALAGLARLDTGKAASQAADVLSAVTPQDDPAPLVDAFLNRQGGAEKLATALESKELPEGAAKMALRYMYSVGRSDQALSDVLSKAAGVATDVPPPTAEEVAKLVAEVNEKGNAARGEQVFRRADVNCMKCHSVSQAGGNVGPELSALGSISPVEYIVNSILNPNLGIKEQYVTKVFLTADGEVFTGIVIDRDDTRVNLRDASGKLLSIPTADIEDEKEGQSLMPQGLTKFLTHEEVLDLAKFVSELGKPGDYALGKTPTIQRWRVLKAPGAELTAEVPNVEILRQFVLDAKPAAWATAYGMVNGSLPLADLKSLTDSNVIYLQGEFAVSEPGVVAFELKVAEATNLTTALWIDAEPFNLERKVEKNLSTGRHTVTVRVQQSGDAAASLKVEVTEPAGSAAQFAIVNGT